jgi:hypothetical protein
MIEIGYGLSYDNPSLVNESNQHLGNIQYDSRYGRYMFYPTNDLILAFNSDMLSSIAEFIKFIDREGIPNE